MKYTQGKIGRIFVVKFEDGDNLLKELIKLAKKERVESGIIHLIGALEKAEIVVGPEKVEIPPTAIWKNFDDGREVLGLGTIFWKGGEPKIHIHSCIGREDKVNIGCIRKCAEVYLVIEAVIIEIDTGSNANVARKFDGQSGLDLIYIEDADK
ncbi:MAG: hypothetical protein A7316_09055 [Candidatus Altiarchaeales archaeon WOR_SM1_86-2]|nr:MAG: hypothetical protein A7316_09055 [Candidatus Altiarchaeales archaeon WOR_SM1_86-2]ODS40322.1 MAG: hypothetical protein A7315_08925 [Candidatus Altiarchaeales archaeon WOR_SM1_79]